MADIANPLNTFYGVTIILYNPQRFGNPEDVLVKHADSVNHSPT